MTDYGIYTLIISIILFFRQSIFDSFSTIVARDYKINNEKLNGLPFIQVKYFTDITFIGLLGTYFLGLIILYISSIEINLLIFSASVFLIATIGGHGVYINVLNISGSRKTAALFIIQDSLLKLTLVGLSVYVLNEGIISLFIILMIGSIISLILIRRYSKNLSNTDINNKFIFKSILKLIIISSPLIIPNMMVALKGNVDKWILAIFLGVDEVGAFTILLQLGVVPITLMAGIIQTYFAPKIYDMCNTFKVAGDKKTLILSIRKILLGIFVLTLISVGFGDHFSKNIFDIFVGNQYSDYSKYLIYFLIAGGFTSASSILYIYILGLSNIKKSGYLLTFSILFTVVINFILIYKMGFFGSIIGLLISGICNIILFKVIIIYELYNKN